MNKKENKAKVVVREISNFLKVSFGSILSIQVLTIVIPILILWEMASRLAWVQETLCPPPSAIGYAFFDLWINGELLKHIGASLLRFFLGFFLALAVSVPIGTLMGWNPTIRKYILPIFQLLAPIPPPAWVPITIILFGIGLPMQVFLVFLGVFYPVLFNGYQGIKDTDPRYITSARVFGASEFTLIKSVYTPHAIGSVIMGIKIGISIGLVMVVISEMVGAHSGVGYLLIESKDFFRLDRMIVCMFILGFIGWFLIEIMKYIENKLSFWKIRR
ncbi:MAG: ABC transporter permease [Nitrospirota bacterium]